MRRVVREVDAAAPSIFLRVEFRLVPPLAAGRCNRGMRERLVRPEPEGPERFFTPLCSPRARDGGVIDVSRPYRGARASAPRNAAVSPSSDSMRKSWLYLAAI